MRWGSGVGALVAAISLSAPKNAAAQGTASDTASSSYSLDTVSVEAMQSGIPRRTQIALGQRNPSMELQLAERDVTLVIPNTPSMPFFNIPGGYTLYWDGVKLLLGYTDFGLVTNITSHNLRVASSEGTAREPSMDKVLDIHAAAEPGFTLNWQPLESSFAAGHKGEAWNAGISGQYQSIPSWLPQADRDEIAILGTAKMAHGFIELSPGRLRLFAEAYGMDHSADLSKAFGFRKYTDSTLQYLGIVSAELPIGNNRLRTTLSRQHGDKSLSALLLTDTLSVNPSLDRLQSLTYTTIETALKGTAGTIGAGVYSLQKSSTIEPHKDFRGWQFFAENTHLFSSGLLRGGLLRTETRLDLVADEIHTSVSVSYKREVLRSITAAVSLASTYDATNAETLGDNLADLSAGQGIAAQRNLHGSLNLTARIGAFTLWTTLDAGKVDALQFLPNGYIIGSSERFGCEYLSAHIDFSTVLVKRNMRLHADQGTVHVPGSPDNEVNTMLTLHGGPHTVYLGLLLRSDFRFPVSREQIDVNLGRQAIGSASYAVALGKHVSIDLAVTNALSWLGQKNFIAEVNNTPLLLPRVYYLGIEITSGNNHEQ